MERSNFGKLLAGLVQLAEPQRKRLRQAFRRLAHRYRQDALVHQDPRWLFLPSARRTLRDPAGARNPGTGPSAPADTQQRRNLDVTAVSMRYTSDAME